MNSIKKITCMINILILSILISSSFSFNIKRLIRNSIVIVPSIILINVNDFANGIDLNNGMTSFKASCASCHNGGGNSVPFSQGKTLSLTDLKNNGYNDVDKMIPLITKVRTSIKNDDCYKIV